MTSEIGVDDYQHTNQYEMATPANTVYNTALANIKGRLDGHYQHEGVKWMLKRELQNQYPKGGILADDMGLGKTIQAITVMQGNVMPTLIITMVGLVGQWKEALIDFGGLKPIIVNSSFVGILPKEVQDQKMVVLTSYSCFQKSKGQIPPCLYQQAWGRIILDEGHIVRNKKTKLFQEISKLSSSIKWILTGTPVQNGEKDLWSLMDLIGATSEVAGQDLESIREQFVLRRTQQEEGKKNARLQLPPLETKVLHIEFATTMEKSIYDEVEEAYATSNTNMNHNAVMEGIIRCRQICSHPMIYFDGCLKKSRSNNGHSSKRRSSNIPAISYYNDGQVNQDFESSKILFLCDDIQKNVVAQRKQCLIFCTWTLEMRLVQRALKKKNIPSLIYDGGLSRDNKETVLYNFKSCNIPVLILQITCGSTGLNLQCASTVYIMSPHWNPCVELQAIGRSYRKGQTNKVLCIRMVMKDTIEERCIDVQADKTAIIAETILDCSIEEKLGSYQECDLKQLLAHPKPVEKSFSAMLDELLQMS